MNFDKYQNNTGMTNAVFEAISHEERRRVLEILKRHGEMAAGDLAEHFAFGKATLSHHLRLLVHAGLIDREKRGRFVYYRINASVFEEVLGMLLDLFQVKRTRRSAKERSHVVGLP